MRHEGLLKRCGWSEATGLAVVMAACLWARDGRADDFFPQLESPEEAHARAVQPPPPAPEPYEAPAAPFGSRGQLVVTNAWTANVSSISFDYGPSRQSAFSLAVATGPDYFVLRNFSIGVDLEVGHTLTQGYGADNSLVRTATTSFVAGPRLGFNLPLGRAFSLYPRATLGVEFAHRAEQVLSGGSASIAGSPTGALTTTQTGPWVSLYVPLLVHPRPHFYLGFGPSIFRDFGRTEGGPDVGAERTRVGAALEVGGYWGGRPPPEVAPSTAPGPSPRFGDAHQVVLTGEIGAGAFWTTFDGTGSSSTSASFSPGLDYFVAKHFSLGVGASAAYSSVKGLDGTLVVTTTTTTFSIAPRVGVDVPLGRWLSLYPRADVYIGYGTANEQAPGSANDSKGAYAGLGLNAPLLLHVVPHWFMGLGPSVSHDLTHSVEYPSGSYEDRRTTVGASFLVGGWL